MDVSKLMQVLHKIEQPLDENLLVSSSPVDDASVYNIGNGKGIVCTLDFFTPIVDDPFTFGNIAAANSLSDIYAMGATPLTALNIICFPEKDLPLDVLHEIIKGGTQKANEAGITISGGHSIDDKEPKYGLSVTGIVDINKMMTTSNAKAGDDIILTKPLGSGILTTAMKKNKLLNEDYSILINTMTELNRNSSEIALQYDIRCCTDITGFGLLGHLANIMKASNLGAEISLKDIPLLPNTLSYINKGCVPGGLTKNYNFLNPLLYPSPEIINTLELKTLFDPQTSGGLLFSSPPKNTKAFLSSLKKYSPLSSIIGKFINKPNSIIIK